MTSLLPKFPPRSAEAAPQSYYLFGLYPVNIAKVTILAGHFKTGEEAGAACKYSPTAVPAHGLYSHQALGQVNNRPPIVVAIRQTWVNGAIGASNHPFTFLPSKSSGYLTR